jgi:cobalt-zinc-cadmium efflux system membrane fusion protein
VQDFVEATGSVQPDKEGVVKITSPLPGVVQSINVQVGDKVKKGQLLAVIKAPDTTDLYSQKISLTAQLEQSKRLYELKQKLYEIGAIPKSELMDAETNYKVIKAQLEGVEQKLRLLGGGMGVSNVRSPIDGVVYQISAHEGIVKYVSDVVDPETHAVKVYIEPLEKEPFKINMFFNIKILIGEKEYAVLPKRVLLYQDGKFYVHLLENGKNGEERSGFHKGVARW